MSPEWTVHKFGGSSVADAAGYERVARIVEAERSDRTAVIVSAMAGVTDALIGLTELAAVRDPAYSAALRQLLRRERELIGDLLQGDEGGRLIATVESDFNDIEDLLRAGWLLRARSRNAVDLISGYGELWSAQVLAAHLASLGHSVCWLDARSVLTVDPGELAPNVRWDAASAALGAWLEHHPAEIVVVPGFVATDPAGLPTTLGRNGSDFTASIFAALLGATSIQIWTDVDGVLSADPRKVPAAVVMDRLSYDEAMELAYFGAKVIHPSTMAPAVRQQIPIRIRNSFRPELPGTLIHGSSGSDHPVKGIATIDDVALLNLEGTGMIGVPGISERLFGALGQAGVSVVMISQGSSEHSICFAIPADQARTARAAVERAFFAERHHGQIQTLDVTEPCSILAVVGDNMAGTPGVAAKFFAALGRAGVNVRAIAQGSSERNISIVLDTADATRAVRAVHAGFYLSDQTLSIGLIGPGIVGSTLLDQLGAERERLRERFNIDLRVRGIASSNEMWLDEHEIALAHWRARRDGASEPLDLERFARHVQTDTIPHAVLIDCTADDGIATRYADWLSRGIHVITPNKKANTADLASWKRLEAAGRGRKCHYLYETTVGAGLPVIQTLRDLIRTGDEILGIEGILSGTLSYLFNAFDGRRPFSEILNEARRLGFTEPDPREDLSGMDVARKVLILAREIGLELSLEDLAIESLVPAGLEGDSVEEFLERLTGFDGEMQELLDAARADGEVLRFVGVVEPRGTSSVRLRRYPAGHPFARIHLTDNVVQFRTARYRENPLVIQGPGAGPEVTAGGIFADLLRLSDFLGGAP